MLVIGLAANTPVLLRYADGLYFWDRFPSGVDHYGQTRLEPLTLLSALAARTTRIGLAATVSTSYNEPYHVARALASPCVPGSAALSVSAKGRARMPPTSSSSQAAMSRSIHAGCTRHRAASCTSTQSCT